MKHKITLPYKLRRALSMATIAGATLVPASCSKVEKEEPHDVVIEFDETNVDKKLEMETLQKLVLDCNVSNIYLHTSGTWGFLAPNISQSRKRFFQPRIELSSKIHGRGNFEVPVGEAAKVPLDSLWFVKNGWTINKQLQK